MKYAAMLVVLFAMAGCGVQREYRDADALTYRAVAPDYAARVRGDATLTPEQRERRLNTLRSWGLRIREAGGSAEDP